MNKIKSLFVYFTIFITIVIGSLFLMICSSKIPKENIQQNTIASAEYLNKKPLFYSIIKDHSETKVDHYADAIILNIAYNLESNDSLKSVLFAKYYGDNERSEIDNLLMTSTNNTYKADTQYVRYWHGAVPFIRILLLFMNVEQIYILNAILLIGLVSLLIYKFIKNKLYILIFAFIIALISTNSFIIPLSLEYTNIYFITIIGSILLLRLFEKKKEKNISKLFFITGILTCYVDFLTTETLSLTFPLIILLIYKYKDNKNINSKELILSIIKLISLWIIGYVLMWVTKWGLSALLLDIDVKKAIIDKLFIRINNTSMITINIGVSNKSVILRNIFCLFPLSFFKKQSLILLLGIILFFVFIFFKGKKKNNILSWTLFLIALIPYIRFCVIYNHSFLHYFFTYRAQTSTIMAIMIGLYYMTDKKVLRGKI